MHWNNNLNPMREFRVFVHNKKVTAISPQKWYMKLPYTPEEFKLMSQSIVYHYNSYLSDQLPYNSVILDVWVDENNKTHLIECNPWGKYASSGSGLFHWIHDDEKLVQNSECNSVYVKYVV
jgi:hypothetical protein